MLVKFKYRETESSLLVQFWRLIIHIQTGKLKILKKLARKKMFARCANNLLLRRWITLLQTKLKQRLCKYFTSPALSYTLSGKRWVPTNSKDRNHLLKTRKMNMLAYHVLNKHGRGCNMSTATLFCQKPSKRQNVKICGNCFFLEALMLDSSHPNIIFLNFRVLLL